MDTTHARTMLHMHSVPCGHFHNQFTHPGSLFSPVSALPASALPSHLPPFLPATLNMGRPALLHATDTSAATGRTERHRKQVTKDLLITSFIFEVCAMPYAHEFIFLQCKTLQMNMENYIISLYVPTHVQSHIVKVIMINHC